MSMTSLYDVVLLGVSAVFVLVMAVVFLWFIQRVKQTTKEQNDANAILTDVLASIYDIINEKEKRIVDLMYRMDILEARAKSQRVVPNMPKNEGVLMDQIKMGDGPVVDSRGVGGGIGRGTSSMTLNLTSTEKILLKSLIGNPKRMSEIKVVLGKSREHTSRLVSSLAKNGLIRKSFVSGQVVCYITDEGRNVVL